MGVLSNFIFHSKFSFCLTCEKFTGGKHSYNEALTHAVGKKHNKNLRTLFRTCIADPFCNCNDKMYSRVIKDAKLDISQLMQSCNEKSYVYEKDENLICYVCEETVSMSKNVEMIQKELLKHLEVKKEAHSQIMKTKAAWIYNIPDSSGFISFNLTTVYCSVCEDNVDFVDDLKLHAAVGHLQTSKHKINVQKSIALDSNVTISPKACGSGGLGISAPPRINSVNSQKPPRHPMNTNVWEYDSIKKLIKDPSYAPHVQFFEFRGNIFMCTLCDVQLTISQSESFNLEEHILGSTHRKYAEIRHIITPDKSQRNVSNKELIPTSTQDQIDKLSEEAGLAPHVKYLEIKGRQCRCTICDYSLTVSTKVNSNLKTHILGKKHKKKFWRTEQQKITDSHMRAFIEAVNASR